MRLFAQSAAKGMKSTRQNQKPMDQLNIFENRSGDETGGQAPLAERMRPRNLGEFIGQSHLLGPGKILDRVLRNRRFHSLILWGPPGCGKTTLAKIIATHTESHLVSLSAVMAGAREIRAAVQEAKEVFAKRKMRTWLLMDEIHRLNKAQQDTLLPHVENGTVLLLGATTENPSFEIIRPLAVAGSGCRFGTARRGRFETNNRPCSPRCRQGTGKVPGAPCRGSPRLFACGLRRGCASHSERSGNWCPDYCA